MKNFTITGPKLFGLAIAFLLFLTSHYSSAQWRTMGSNTYYSGGNVGIGTADFSDRLVVGGILNIKSRGVTLKVNGDEALWYNGTYYSWGFGGEYNYFADKILIGDGGQQSSTATLHLRKAHPSITLESTTQNGVKLSINAGGWTTFHADKADMGFQIGNKSILHLDSRGKVGIGTVNPNFKLDVCGKVRAKDYITDADWCDYVFEDDYDLRPLNEVEAFVKENKHLPEIPPASEVEANGLELGDMSTKLMLKIEELTLYLIDQNKQIQTLKEELNTLKNK